MDDDIIFNVDVCYADINLFTSSFIQALYFLVVFVLHVSGCMLCAFVLAVRRVRPFVCLVICVCAALELVWVLYVIAACIPVLFYTI